MVSLQDLKDQLKWRESHAFCKHLLSNKRKLYKCPQGFITAKKWNPNDSHWEVYIDPQGCEGSFSGCCKYSAMIKALDSRFQKK